MHIVRHSIQAISALAFSCFITFAVPSAASSPHQHAQPKTLREASPRKHGDTAQKKTTHHTGASIKRSTIQARPRPEGKKRRPGPTAQQQHPAPAPAAACLHPAVRVAAPGAEAESLPLTECNGAPTHQALTAVARWLDGSATKSSTPQRHGARVTAAQSGLVARLQAIATAFADHTLKLHAPCSGDAGRAGHQSGHALDVEVEGVSLDKQMEVCRTLPDTACGQIGGEPFVHVEIRRGASGHLYWFDTSEPTK